MEPNTFTPDEVRQLLELFTIALGLTMGPKFRQQMAEALTLMGEQARADNTMLGTHCIALADLLRQSHP